MKADLVFFNGPVLSVDSKDSIFSGAAVKENKIVFTGSSESVLEYTDEKTRLIDLKGRSLVPGFIDSHLHTGVLGANALGGAV